MKRYLVIGIITVSALFAKEQSIVFGAGCFWGVEKYFEGINGVKTAVSGYAGGDYENPNYKKILNNRANSKIKNYAEVVKVTYDDSKVTTQYLVEKFWELHDPTQGDRQGNDIGNNYRSTIYYTNNEQKNIALKTKKIYQNLLKTAGYGDITTEIKPLAKFYKAEDYHQDYLKRNPNGYCPNHSTGVKFKKTNIKSKNTISPLGEKEIVVIDALDCPFCEKFKADVIDKYIGNVPLRVVKLKELKGFNISGKIEGTPTILFIVQGKEIARHRGYLSQKEFYKALGEFKLGRGSKAYNIAFNKSTESRFCKKYDKFKHTKSGSFIDSVSGDILFDTKDRFNSKSGWLSFYKAVDGAVEFKEDNSYGMHRIEVIAKKSGIHLGHVFDRDDGTKRFCINANVLEFVPKDKKAK